MTSQSLQALVGQLLIKNKLTLAVAESCTGGLICHLLTNVPGSSAYFLGGVVAYAYDAKESLLGVQHNTLYDFGAVSEPTARQMARGARRALGADVGLAVTGIAGPGGGLPDKPVGLTWIAISTRAGEHTRKFIWDSDREGNKQRSAVAALEMLKEHLQRMTSTRRRIR